jgi:hypothetical protein
MKPKPNSAMNLIKRVTQLQTVLLVLSIMSSLGYANAAGWQCPCFSEEEFIAMRDGVSDVEPYDQISLFWYTNHYRDRGNEGVAFGGEEDMNGDGAWTWVENSLEKGNWCFYQLVQDGFTVEERTLSDLTTKEFKACYEAIEEEYLAQ